MEWYALALFVTVFSFNAFCQMPRTYHDPGYRNPAEEGFYPVPKMVLSPLEREELSSQGSDSVVLKFRSLSYADFHNQFPSLYIKGIKQCKDCIVKKGSEGQPLSGKFRSSVVSSTEGSVNSLYSLLGGRIKYKSCFPPDEIIRITKIISQKKYLISYHLTVNDSCNVESYKEFWIIIPKAEDGFTFEYDFTVENEVK